MTRAGTRTTMKRQPVRKTKMEKVYADVQKFTKDKKIADKLIEKYGVDCAYAIVRQCMQEPANVIKRTNSNQAIWRTGDAIKFFAQSTLKDDTVAKGIKKTEQFVKTSKNTKNQTPEAVKSVEKVNKKAVDTGFRFYEHQPETNTAAKSTAPAKAQKTKAEGWKMPSLTKGETDWEKAKKLGQPKPKPKTIDEQVADELARLKKENPNGVTLGTLKKEGFVAGINSKVITPDKFQYLHAGKDGKGLGNAVKKATKTVVGKDQCGAAVRKGYTDYMNNTYHLDIPKNEAEFYGKRKKDGSFEWGSSAAETLHEKFNSDYFTVLSYPNKGTNSALSNVPDGTTIFYEGKDGRKLNGADHPGHTATYNATDGCWYAGNYSQYKSKINNGAGYGKNYRIAIANDTTVDDELLKQIIREQIQQNERHNQNQGVSYNRGQERA